MPQPNPEYISELVEIVNSSPFPEHMAMRLLSIELEKAVIELKTANYHLQAYGIVHGGVLATLIDTATFWSVYLRIPEDALFWHPRMQKESLTLPYIRNLTSSMKRP